MRKSDGSNKDANEKLSAANSGTESAANEVIIVPCPMCKKDALFSRDNPYRPFCSERCQMTDLGTWAQEKYRIPTPNTNSEFDSENDVNEESDSDSENRH